MIDGSAHSELWSLSHCDPLDFVIDPREAVVTLTVRPAFDTGSKSRQHGREGVDKFRSDNDMLRRYNVDRVRQRVAGKIGVEQRNDPADPRYPEPDGHVFRAIWHEQTDYVAGRETLPQRPTRILIRSLRESAIRQAVPVGKQSWRRTKSVSQRFDENRERDGSVSGNGRCHFERAHPRFEWRVTTLARIDCHFTRESAATI